MPKNKFNPGDLVFAKVKGYPPWPARITGIASKDRYKIYFYGTYEIATVKGEDIWLYSQETKEKFAPKNMKRKGYTEGIDQIENTPEIAPVDGEYEAVGDLPTPDLVSQGVIVNEEAPKKAKAQKQLDIVKKTSTNTPKSTSKSNKRKAEDSAEGATPAKRVVGEISGDEGNVSEEKFSRSGRAIKPKKFGDDVIASPKPVDNEPVEKMPKISTKSPKKEGAQISPIKSDSEPRKMWVKVKNTDDLIEINLDKDRPESFESNEAKIEWEMASARKALKFKKRVESGEFIPPEIKKKLEEKEKLSSEDRAVLDREKLLEKRKNKLRWLKIEQKLVDLDIAVKTALHLERPAPDRCITALDELNELALAPLMLKKQPDIVTTIRRLRKYIGPQSYCNWPDKEARDKMERAVQTIQTKADQIYNKFKSFFAFQEGDRTFWEMFEAEVNEFKNKTAGMDESKILSLIRDPTKPLSNLNPLSDEEEL